METDQIYSLIENPAMRIFTFFVGWLLCLGSSQPLQLLCYFNCVPGYLKLQLLILHELPELVTALISALPRPNEDSETQTQSENSINMLFTSNFHSFWIWMCTNWVHFQIDRTTKKHFTWACTDVRDWIMIIDQLEDRLISWLRSLLGNVATC